VTVLEVIQRSTDFLTRKGVESARLHTELLLAHVLQMPRMKLYLNFDRTMTEPELQHLRDLIKRRGEREPLQHLTGSTSFCGLEIAVNRDVLIPRPETELLAERAWKYLGSLGESSPAALDFGTGSGCVAIAIATHAPHAVVHALDISEAALAVARGNAARHGLGDRIRFACGNGLVALPAGFLFDLVVANPPYISTEEIAILQPEVRDYDPRLALDGGVDGLDFYRRLAAGAGAWLKPGGKLMAEFGDGQEIALREIFAATPWWIEAIEPDNTGRARILITHLT